MFLIVDLALGLVERGLTLVTKVQEMADNGGELSPEQRAQQGERIKASETRMADLRRQIEGS